MTYTVNPGLIPGTVLNKKDLGNVSGIEFLNKIFFVSNGVMLGQLREISGVDGSTLQNWVKRGWIGNTVNKRYSKDQLARILIINMMRSSMMLEKIDYILHYINGNIEDKSDDIISEAELYGYICDIYDEFTDSGLHKVEDLRVIIDKITKEKYAEPFEGAKTRLDKALEIILVAYFASNAAAFANILFNAL
jgi:DNA-binding transcriptional MerR regulator